MKVIGPAANSGRGPSGSLWGNCPVMDIIEDPNVGVITFDDFLTFNPLVSSNVGYGNGYYSYEDTTSSILQLATEVNGVARILLEAAANEEAAITGGKVAGFAKIDSSAPKDLWFETRVRFGGITDQAAFIGLAEEACPANGLLADTTPVMSKDQVGFTVAIATPAALNAAYAEATTPTIHSAGVQTLVAATWYKLGMMYDARNDYMKWFINGVQVGTSLDVSATTAFPDGEELTWLFALKTVTGAARTLDIDWVRVAQLAIYR